MVTRRNALILGLGGPLLAACGGGGEPGDNEAVIRTSIASDDWPTGTPESQSITTASVNAMMASADKLPALRSMLVVRNGVLVAERYFNDARASDLQHVRSATKTISSLLIGQAIQDGKIRSVSATLRELLPAELAKVPNSVAGDITLRQVLQMRSGLKFDDASNWDVLFSSPNLAGVALGLPATGRNAWNYDSATSHLPSLILATAYGEANALNVATRKLFAPLGIKEVAWSHDASGATHGSFGLQIRSRDMAKIGWMALDGGRWQGRSIISPDWLAESMTDHASVGSNGVMMSMGYGYLWWSGFMGGHRFWTAWGHGGQFIILVPGVNMVVISTSDWKLAPDPAYNNALAAASAIAGFLATLVAS